MKIGVGAGAGVGALVGGVAAQHIQQSGAEGLQFAFLLTGSAIGALVVGGGVAALTR